VIIGQLLGLLSRHAAKCLAAGVLIGLAAPPLAEVMRPALTPSIFVSLVLALTRLEITEVAAYLRRPVLLTAFTAFSLLVSPLLMLAVVLPIGLPEGLTAGLVLMAAAPPITSAAAFALIMRLEAAFSVAAVVVAYLLVPFTLPVMAFSLLQMDIDIGWLELTGRLAAMIGGSFLAGILLRRFLGAERIAGNAASIDGLAVISLVVFAIAIMDGVTEVAFARPGYVALATGAAFIANGALQVLGAMVFWRAGRLVALTAGHMTGNCNMGLILAVLADQASVDLAVFFALGQLPMYMLPLVAVPVYQRLLPLRR
jgi:BASS family bile acid:Na+ symporter